MRSLTDTMGLSLGEVFNRMFVGVLLVSFGLMIGAWFGIELMIRMVDFDAEQSRYTSQQTLNQNRGW